MSRLVLINFTVILCIVSGKNIDNEGRPNNYDEQSPMFWRSNAQSALKRKLMEKNNLNVAKNVILFLGDGMSITTLAAARVYVGQKNGHTGEELKLVFEDFPITGLAKPYCVDANVADSACSGTAYLTGVKSNMGTVGVSAKVKLDDCGAQFGGENDVTGLIAWAQKAGKATGIVTTTRVTHATPAAAYAHSASRKWESDRETPDPRCRDIASQLVQGDVGSKIDVVLGGGRGNFLPLTYVDYDGSHGNRKDNADLINEWIKNKLIKGATPKYVQNKKQLLDISPQYDSVLGLFSSDHMPYRIDADKDLEPSLSEMTQKAVHILSRNKNGFLLFVEGGRIDTAHHETKARKALDETAEFAKAVEAAMRIVNPENTLVVVTSDHSHTMTYSGYGPRGSDILGFTTFNKSLPIDRNPITILTYANGPGYKPHENNLRPNISIEETKKPNFAYPALAPLHRETHAGEDVAVFAKGPWSHIFTGNYEQNYIPHAIAFAACIGDGLTACQ